MGGGATGIVRGGGGADTFPDKLEAFEETPGIQELFNDVHQVY